MGKKNFGRENVDSAASPYLIP